MADTTQILEKLVAARDAGAVLEPIFGSDDLEQAFAVQGQVVGERVRRGYRVTGLAKSSGLSGPAFGAITADMFVDDTDAVALAGLVAPRITASLAFLLKADLVGGRVGVEDVIAATDLVFPAIDVLDAHVAGEGLGLADVVADNGFGAFVVLGDGGRAATAVDLERAGVVVEVNGGLSATGAGAAALGHPARAVAWLANQLHALGGVLAAGDLVLAGELTAPIAVKAGDAVRVTVGGLGNAGLRFQ